MPRKEPVSGSHFPSLFSLPLPPHSLGRAPSLNPNPFCKQSLKPTTSEVFVLFIKLLAFPGTSLFLHREFSSFDFFSPHMALFIHWFVLGASQFAGDRKMLKNTANKIKAK